MLTENVFKHRAENLRADILDIADFRKIFFTLQSDLLDDDSFNFGGDLFDLDFVRERVGIASEIGIKKSRR